MKKMLITLAVLLTAASVNAGDLDQTIACPNGGKVILTGTFDHVSMALDGHLEAKDCIIDDGTQIISGKSDVKGTLGTLPGTEIHLTVTYVNVSITEIERGNPDSFNRYVCSGDWGINGSVAMDGSVNYTHSSNLNCQVSGKHALPMDQFINGLIFFQIDN